MQRITHTGHAATASTPIDGQVGSYIALRASADAVVKIDDHQINLFAVDSYWFELEINFNKFEIVSGTVDYVICG